MRRIPFCEVGVQLFRKTADFSVYDLAMKELKQAEVRIGDPQITALVRKYEQRISGQALHALEVSGTPGESVEEFELSEPR